MDEAPDDPSQTARQHLCEKLVVRVEHRKRAVLEGVVRRAGLGDREDDRFTVTVGEFTRRPAVLEKARERADEFVHMVQVVVIWQLVRAR